MGLVINTDFLSRFIDQYPQLNLFWIAYSGGLDSHVLLHAMVKLANDLPIQLQVIHINHGLSPNAKAWENHCMSVCDELKLQCHVVAVNAKSAVGQSREAVAREARYAAFKDIVGENHGLFTAHHQDDQTETILLQLLRGAGPKGLSGMPEVKPFGRGWLLRPFLQIPRAELHDYAIQNKLHWIEDESNFDTSFQRNFIRHQLIPAVKKRWPAVNNSLSRGAQNCQELVKLADEIAQSDLEKCQGPLLHTLLVNELNQLSFVRKNYLLRYWLQKLNLPLPSRIKLQHLEQNVLQCRADAMPLLTWTGVEIRRHRHLIYALSPIISVDTTKKILWNFPSQESCLLPNELGTLKICKTMGNGIQIPKESMVSVRFRQGGEVCKPQGRAETHTLKKLFQEWDVPPWERDRIPLIYYDETIAAVVGHCYCDPFAVKQDEEGVVIV